MAGSPDVEAAAGARSAPGPAEDVLTMAPAGPGDVAAVWCRVPPASLAYWSAVHWLPPLDARRAERWFDERDGDRLFLLTLADAVGFAALTPEGDRVRCYRVRMAFPDLPDWSGPGALAIRELTRFALGAANANRCEWPVLSTWHAQRAAAQELGYVLEVTYPDACVVDGRYVDMELLGVLRDEWRPQP